MKKQLIIVTTLFVGFSAQASMYEKMKVAARAAREKYEAASAAAQSGYAKAKGLAQQYAPGVYESARGLVQQYAPSVQEFAKDFIEKNMAPMVQSAVQSVVKTLLFNDTVDQLRAGIPYGNEIVDQIRTVYMSRYYPTSVKNVTFDIGGNKIVQWSDASKATAGAGKPMSAEDLAYLQSLENTSASSSQETSGEMGDEDRGYYESLKRSQ